MTPINLMKLFGNRFRIAWDGAYNPKNVPRDKLDSSYMELPCRFGQIYAYDENSLAVMVDYHRKIAAIISRIPGVETLQDGDDEKTFRFPLEMFNEIAAIVKPHRKPQLTEQQKREAAERLREFQFRPAMPTGIIDQNTHV